jgi:Flp pilus assembly CpaE family ATPase
MNPTIGVTLETPLPESLSADALSIAVIGPDTDLRKAVVSSLAGCHGGPVKDFSSYPPSLDELPKLLGQRHDIIMIEWDSNPEYALDLVEGICSNGAATVMVYSKESDPELADSDLLMRCMRAGAREFLGMPFSHDMMAEALIRAAARRPPTGMSKQTGGRLLVFCGAKGGAGVTAIACNFALALTQESSQSVLLIDLDLPLGDAALNLGVTPQYSTVDALKNFSRLDSTFLGRLIVKHSSGISVLAAPGSYPEYRASDEATQKLLLVARQNFENVVVDVGSKLDFTGNADTFRDATTIYLVTQAGVPELRNANRLISQYFRSGSPNLEVVLNRYEPKSTRISDDDIKKALSRPAKWKIPSDYVSMRRMQDTATSVMSTDSSVSRELGQMARSVCGLPESHEKRRSFSLRNLTKGFSAKISSEDPISISPINLSAISDHSDQASGTPQEDISAYPVHLLDSLTLSSEVLQGSVVISRQDEPETRFYNGNTYAKGADGQWYIKQIQTVRDRNDSATITWNTPDPITYGTPLNVSQLSATASVPGTFAYVPPKGFILPAGKHTLWVTFSPQSDATQAMQASVSLAVTKATPSINWSRPSAISCGTPLSVDQLNATASVPGTFEYSPSAGEVLAEGPQKLLVSFTPSDSENYEAALAEVPIVVVREKPTITWAAPHAITYGTPLSEAQLNARASVPGKLTYTPAEGAVLATGRHKISVSFAPTEITNYTAAEAEVFISVAKARPTITWPAPAAISYGTPLGVDHLNATASTAGTFAYTPGEGAMLSAGRHKPAVTFTPSDPTNYASAQSTITLIVAKAAPIITWPAPADIPYGAELSSDQLNAKASIPGSFVYDPDFGALLPEGPQTLRVSFIPDDAINFATVEAAVAFNVSKARPITITWPAPSEIAYGTPLGFKELNASAPVAGTFAYSPSMGAILPAGEHSLSVVFTPTDSHFSPADSEVALMVNKAEPAISWTTPEAITYGTPLGAAHLNAKATVPGTFVYTPSEGTSAAAGIQTISVTFTPDDTANYTEATSEVSLTITEATPHILWSEPAPISYGAALGSNQLNAEVTMSGTFVYAPVAGTVLTTGLHAILATFIPDDSENYAMAHAAVSLQVNEQADISLFTLTPHEANDEGALPPAQMERSHSVIPIRTVETKTDMRTPFVARSVGSVQTPIVQISAQDAVNGKPVAMPTGRPLSIGNDTQTRTYKGQIYKKGADGQWHLQQD